VVGFVVVIALAFDFINGFMTPQIPSPPSSPRAS
jgi:hypothetical protein